MWRTVTQDPISPLSRPQDTSLSCLPVPTGPNPTRAEKTTNPMNPREESGQCQGGEPQGQLWFSGGQHACVGTLTPHRQEGMDDVRFDATERFVL